MTKPTTDVTSKSQREAQPFKEGRSHAIRVRYKRNDIYLSNVSSEAAARKAAHQVRVDIDARGAPKGRGPDKTTAAQALQDYAMKRLPFKKGAVQEAVRMNVYLRAAHLDTLLVKPIEAAAPAPTSTTLKKTKAGITS